MQKLRREALQALKSGAWQLPSMALSPEPQTCFQFITYRAILTILYVFMSTIQNLSSSIEQLLPYEPAYAGHAGFITHFLT